MKVSGFTFIRNALKFDYPIEAAIRSILPLCDEMVVCVGNSEDDTLALIQSLDSQKIKIIHSVWDDRLKKGGEVLATETNKAFAEVAADSDWAFYIQGDEVIHENDYDTIRKALKTYKDDKTVECLVLNYLHFYGNYKYTADSRKWYRREMRIIKNDKTIQSFRDAQGFRRNGKRLNGKLIDASVYHYGWVKNPYLQKQKIYNFNTLYSNEKENLVLAQTELYDYKNIDSLKLFTGTHPAAIQKRIMAMDWDFEFDMSRKQLTIKEIFSRFVEKHTGKRLFEFRNYSLI
ncbi:MAG: hypothetical protein FWC10_10470 [Lentimicrobiaceae bacterium]|nr:hypothetical protein [Lentimicrobiaceae bacterium]